MATAAEVPSHLRSSPLDPAAVLLGVTSKQSLATGGMEKWWMPLTEDFLAGEKGFQLGNSKVLVRFLAFIGDSPAQSEMSGHLRMTSYTINPCSLCTITRNQLSSVLEFPRRKHATLLETSRYLPTELDLRSGISASQIAVSRGERDGLRFRSSAIRWSGFHYVDCRRIEFLHLEPQGNIIVHLQLLLERDPSFWDRFAEEIRRIRFSYVLEQPK